MSEAEDFLPLPKKNGTVLNFLKHRRSNLAKLMSGPGPSEAQLEELLTIAARVPDHRKLAPWRFLIFQGEARADFGQQIAKVFKKENPDASPDKVDFEAQRFSRAPLVVGVISSPKVCPRGTPEWEQILSAGAVCYNLCLAAQANGFGAQWLTEWLAYDADIQNALGLSEAEKIAGFIYIGTATVPSKERPRPDLSALTEYWTAEID